MQNSSAIHLDPAIPRSVVDSGGPNPGTNSTGSASAKEGTDDRSRDRTRRRTDRRHPNGRDRTADRGSKSPDRRGRNRHPRRRPCPRRVGGRGGQDDVEWEPGRAPGGSPSTSTARACRIGDRRRSRGADHDRGRRSPEHTTGHSNVRNLTTLAIRTASVFRITVYLVMYRSRAIARRRRRMSSMSAETHRSLRLSR
jgi:hypothetical protein